jgi:hypothetical protein
MSRALPFFCDAILNAMIMGLAATRDEARVGRVSIPGKCSDSFRKIYLHASMRCPPQPRLNLWTP